jgi:hypothetical protein
MWMMTWRELFVRPDQHLAEQLRLGRDDAEPPRDRAEVGRGGWSLCRILQRALRRVGEDGQARALDGVARCRLPSGGARGVDGYQGVAAQVEIESISV